MVGNVEEWTEDCYNEDSYKGAPSDGSAWSKADCLWHVVRGGSWNVIPRYLRSAVRGNWSTERQSKYLGFRVGRTLLPP